MDAFNKSGYSAIVAKYIHEVLHAPHRLVYMRAEHGVPKVAVLCEIAPERAGGSWVKENRDWTLVAEGMRIPVFFYAVDQFGDHSGVGDQAACFPGPGRPAQYASFGPVFRDVHSISTWGISCSHPFLHFSVHRTHQAANEAVANLDFAMVGRSQVVSRHIILPDKPYWSNSSFQPLRVHSASEFQAYHAHNDWAEHNDHRRIAYSQFQFLEYDLAAFEVLPGCTVAPIRIGAAVAWARSQLHIEVHPADVYSCLEDLSLVSDIIPGIVTVEEAQACDLNLFVWSAWENTWRVSYQCTFVLSPLPVYHATFAGPETQRGSSSTPVVAIINDRGVLKAKLFGYHLGIYEFKGSGEPAYQRIVLLTDAARVLEEERGIRLMTENTSLSLVW